MNKQWTIMILLSIILVGLIVSLGMVYVLNDEKNIVDNANVVSQERTLEGFDAIALDGIGDVKVHPGEEFKVVVTADSKIQEKIITKVEGNTLHINEDENFKTSDAAKLKNLTIDVYMPELKNVSLNGGGNIDILEGNGSELEISISGIGNVDAKKYKVVNANVKLSGTGDISVWATQTLNGEISGTGNIDALKGSVETANVILSGTGDISVWVSQTLKGELSGIGSILYKGNPYIKDIHVNGVGSVERYD
ncbi:MAG: DUF2807 domain-containing protein [Methanobrevibacter sp.]|nr:DUF2807 domain-containing protein [Methanobrevibacter sp.]